MTYKTIKILIVILVVILSSLAHAAEEALPSDVGFGQELLSGDSSEESIPTLKQVTVVGQPEDPLSVKNTLKRDQLDHLPSRNGSINEAISILPGVQLGEEHRTSDNAGEILPPNLSISGGRFYENNFIIDGLGNNSLLDPSGSDIDSSFDTPGHPQESFLHPDLIDKVTVYRSNISARYGQFTGGVVEVETRDPGVDFSGTAHLRHTRSEWTAIHQDSERKEEYDYPRDGSVQPEFRKYDSSFSLDLPINDEMGVLAAYSMTYSKIPLLQVGFPSLQADQTENQYRTLENYFLKYVANLGSETQWSLTGTYTPYQAEYFRDEVVNSRYTLNNDAYTLASNLETRLGKAEVEFNLGYHKSTNSRQAPDNSFTWQVTPSKPWGGITDAGQRFQYSKEGGYGNLDKEQETYSINVHVSVDPLQSNGLWHNLNFGFGYEEIEGRFDRNNEMHSYILASKNSSVVCIDGATDCISGEQFMWYKQIYPADAIKTRIRFYDAYIEEQISFGRLSFRPGLRISYDDLQGNTNWAQRLSAGYDLFGDASTQLIAGFNRYYGKTLLANALKEETTPTQIWTRSKKLNPDNSPSAWSYRPPRNSIATVRLSDLSTPYTDEITFGINQQLFGGLLNVTYVKRESDDELATTVVDEFKIDENLTYKYTEWTNNGSSSHNEVSAYWERAWAKHSLHLGAAWQETATSNSDYDERADDPDDNNDGVADPVWYQGELMDREELPRPDYNRKYTGTVTYTGRLPAGFTFTNVTRYRSGYHNLVTNDENHTLPSGQVISVYEKKKQPESWIFDWRIDWEKALFGDQSLIATVEINNVFNQKVEAGGNDNVYDLGRQFWLGMTYKF